MKKRFYSKKIIAIISVCVMLSVLLTMNTFAAMPENDMIQPLWDSIHSIELDMGFDGSDGVATGIAARQSTSSLIEGTLTVYKKVNGEWVFVDDAYNSRTRETMAVNVEFAAESGVTYKAEFTVTAYTNNIPETETVEYIDTCP